MDNQNDGSPRAGVYPGAGRSQISRPHATQAPGDATKIQVATFGASLVILFNVAYGVMNARKTRLQAAQVMEWGRRDCAFSPT